MYRQAQRTQSLSGGIHRIVSSFSFFHASLSKSFANVSATIHGKTSVASAYSFTGAAVVLILPHEMASSGRAPESEPSYLRFSG